MEHDYRPIQNNISTIFIHFDNLKEASEWYVSRLGLKIRRQDLVKGYVEMDMEGANLTLLTWRTDRRIRPDHPSFCFYTADVEKAYNELKARRVDVMDIKNAGSVSGFQFKDLEGNMLLVCN